MTDTPWKAMRDVTGLSQREVERRLGWKSGHLSWIERGATAPPEKVEQLRTFYRDALLSQSPARIAE